MTHHIDLGTLDLLEGGHETREGGVCLLEAVAWWAGEDHTDHPACVSPVLGAFGRSWNDVLPDDRRHILKPFIPLLPGTAGDGQDLARSYLALDWLARTCAPAFLDLTPALAPHAATLRGLPRLLDADSVRSARQVLSAAWAAAWAAAGTAARTAAGDAAGDAAWTAAWTAAWDAAWTAAWTAAWDAARTAAWDAARTAAGAAAGDAAGDAAGTAAWTAAWDAAWTAAWDAARTAAWDAARTAAGAALAPTVRALQESALGLYRAMLHPQATP